MIDRQDMIKARKKGKFHQKAFNSAESKAKEFLRNYTKQLVSLGTLQQAIVLNIQKEIEKIA